MPEFTKDYLQELDAWQHLSIGDWRKETANWSGVIKALTRMAREKDIEKRQEKAQLVYDRAQEIKDEDMRTSIEMISLIWNMPDEVLDNIIASFED